MVRTLRTGTVALQQGHHANFASALDSLFDCFVESIDT